MRLAERWQVGWSLAAAAAGLALAVTTLPSQPAPQPAVRCPQAAVAPPRASCPAFARARLRVDDAAVVTCLRGHFGQPGYFLHAFYKTTEWWERELIVSEDGSQELVPAVDEPSLAIANDGDAVAFHVMAPNDDGAATVYQRPPRHPESGADWIWIRSRDRLHVLIPSSADGGAFQHRDVPVTGNNDSWNLELVGGRLIER